MIRIIVQAIVCVYIRKVIYRLHLLAHQTINLKEARPVAMGGGGMAAPLLNHPPLHYPLLCPSNPPKEACSPLLPIVFFKKLKEKLWSKIKMYIRSIVANRHKFVEVMEVFWFPFQTLCNYSNGNNSIVLCMDPAAWKVGVLDHAASSTNIWSGQCTFKGRIISCSCTQK